MSEDMHENILVVMVIATGGSHGDSLSISVFEFISWLQKSSRLY